MLKSKSYRIIFICLFFIVATLLGAWLVFDNFATTNAIKTQQNLSAIALAKKTQIETFLAERQQDAYLLSIRPAVWQTLAASDGPLKPDIISQRLHLDIEETASIYGYNNVLVLDKSLHNVASLRAMDINLIEHAVFNAVLATHKPAIVDMHVDSGNLYFGIAMPVFEQGNNAMSLAGIVYLEIDVKSRLYPLLAEWPAQTKSAETLLVEKQGNELIYLSQLKYAPDIAPMSLRHTVSEVYQEIESTALTDNDYRGVKVIGAAIPVQNTPWLILAKVDYEEINEPVSFLLRLIALGTTIVLILMAKAGQLLWRVKYADQIAREVRLNQRYTAARQASIDAYIVFDESLRILDANQRMVMLTGYTLDELLARTLLELDLGLTPAEITGKLEDIQKTGGTRLRTTSKHKNGTPIDIEVSASFIADPAGNAFHAFVHDITAELAAQRRIERLNTFNVFLSHANAVIFNLSSPKEILSAVCEGAVRDGGFILSWAGLLDETLGRVLPIASFGPASDYMRELVITTDPLLPTSHGPTRLCMMEQKIMYANDFQNDELTLPWHELARQHGLNSAAAVPIIVNGKAVASITFYSAMPGYFDVEFRGLLEETARNVSLALQAVSAGEEKLRAEVARRASEELFQRAFDASPIPMRIDSLASRKTRYINKAHVRVFGYTMEDIPDETSWFDQLCADPVIRQQLQDQWYNVALPDAIHGGSAAVVESPEITLRCKDGSHRICVGLMSVVADDVIMQWKDITEQKLAEANIAASEKRFRGIIEQTLTGIYVNQHGRLVYVNPRFCEISGWSHDELLGNDSLQLYSPDAESRQKVLEARTRLEKDESQSVVMELQLKRKDGTLITVDTYGSMSLWDGEPAFIVMVLDITEQRRDQARIAQYAKQLEGAMEGTLHAVANMIEQRDPYTSGHELRVGIIAADIAREMGWTEERCNLLRLIGLVHDIGKISVPAEILSRPSRLTPLEYEIIKTHAEKGYEILKDVDSPWPIAEIIRQHHERLDGSGYPHGLKGEEILPEARILAVADVLESMASHRPYRPAKGIDAAIAEIETHRGQWFDPVVVDALLVLIHEKGYQLPA